MQTCHGTKCRSFNFIIGRVNFTSEGKNYPSLDENILRWYLQFFKRVKYWIRPSAKLLLVHYQSKHCENTKITILPITKLWLFRCYCCFHQCQDKTDIIIQRCHKRDWGSNFESSQASGIFVWQDHPSLRKPDERMDNDSPRIQERVIPINVIPNAKAKKFHISDFPKDRDGNSNDVKTLPVTLSDGTTTQTQAIVTPIGTKNNPDPPTEVEIQEIGQETLERERNARNNNRIQVNTKSIPIKLHSRKIVQVDPEETTMEMKSEFTRFSHQEFSPEDPLPPRIKDPDLSPLHNRHSIKHGNKTGCCKERVIPILIENTGETIRPSFQMFQDPEPPEWSDFSHQNKNNKDLQEKVLVLKF